MGALSRKTFSSTALGAKRRRPASVQPGSAGAVTVHTIESPRDGITPVLVTGAKESLYGVSGKTPQAFLKAVQERLGPNTEIKVVVVDSLGAARPAVA